MIGWNIHHLKMFFLLNIGIFQMIILVFRGVIHFVSINRTVTIERVCKVKGFILPWQEGWHLKSVTANWIAKFDRQGFDHDQVALGFGSSQGIRMFASGISHQNPCLFDVLFFLVIPQNPFRANVMGCLPKPSSNFKPPIVHHSWVDFFPKKTPLLNMLIFSIIFLSISPKSSYNLHTS